MRRILRGRRKALIASALLLTLIVATYPLWLQAVGDLLALREAPVQADAVVALGGDNLGGRALRGAELVREGYAPKLYVLDDASCVRGYCVRWSDLWRAGVRSQMSDIEQLIPRESVVPLLDDIRMSPGTYEEAQAAWSRLKPLGVHRILLVTDEFHSRRATLSWRKVVDGGAEVVSVPCTTWCTSVRGWWRNRESLKSVWLEFARFAAYIAMGHV